MATRVTATLMVLPMTELKVSVNACWAPSTSLLSRDIKAPVWVRVKKAIGMRWMWMNTLLRMSNMRPSPTREEIQRSQRPSAGVEDRQSPRQHDEPVPRAHGRVLWLSIQLVDDRPGKERVGGADQGVDDDQHQEQGEGRRVGLGEAHDALDDPLGELVAVTLSSRRIERMRP